MENQVKIEVCRTEIVTGRALDISVFCVLGCQDRKHDDDDVD